MRPVLYLASRSPRRRILLEQLGIGFRTLSVDLDETWDGREAARPYVERLALAKAQAGAVQVAGQAPLPVLGADTAVVLDEVIFGQPADREEALRMLAQLSGRCHAVYTAVALVNLRSNEHQVRVSLTTVWFRPLAPAEREAYWASGEPLGKAGAYAIQGRAAAFIERIEGSYTGVMGLPLYETAQLLASAGVMGRERAAHGKQ